MKQLLALLAISGSIIACNNSAQEKETSKDSATTTDTTSATMTPAPDTTKTAMAPAKDSLMQFKNGKVMIMTGGAWSALTATVTTSNGRKVSPDGEVSKNGKKRKLEEGMMIDKDGQLMDKDGKPLDQTGWE